MEKLGTQQGWSNPAPDEYSTFGYPQEIQDFMEAIAMDREPKSGMRVARRHCRSSLRCLCLG